MEIKSNPTKQNTAQIVATFNKEDQSKAETESLKHLSSHKTLKGFRQGKAPLNLIKDSVSPEELKDEIIIQLANQAAHDAIAENKYDLVGQPFVSSTNTDKPDAWEITLDFPLYPKFNIDNYQTLVKSVKVPKTKKETGPNDKLDLILKAFLKDINFEVPQSLIDQEVQHSLMRLIDQAQTLSLSIDKYLEALHKTIADVKKEYTTKAIDNLKLEFILTAIAEKEAIAVTAEDLSAFTSAAQIDPKDESRLRPILTRRKTIDFLLNL